MTENDTLHLWFKPFGGTMNDADVAFVERYSRRFYPKAMTELSKQIKRLAAKVTRMCAPHSFEYQLTHHTQAANNRYVIEESLRDVADANGLNFGIQATTPEERRVFADCFNAEQSNTASTQSVQQVVAYLEDTIQSEAHHWSHAKMANGQDAMPVLQEVISFLKSVKNVVRVHSFEVNYTQAGIVLTVVLVSPGVLSYYARIDWTIV